MKRPKTLAADDDMLPEYDFNVVVLDSDVSKAFPNAAAVNQALRTLASAARRSIGIARRASSPARRPTKRMMRSTKAKRRGPRG
jgi:hypothetical protein